MGRAHPGEESFSVFPIPVGPDHKSFFFLIYYYMRYVIKGLKDETEAPKNRGFFVVVG